MVEFVIVASLLFFLLFGIMEFGFMMSTQLTLQAAAHQGARAAALGKPALIAGQNAANPISVQKSVDNALAGLNKAYLVNANGYTASANSGGGWTAWTPGTSPTGGNEAQIRVTVQYRYRPITFVGSMLKDTGQVYRTMSADSVMRFGG